MWLETVALATLVLILVWIYSKHRHNYWNSRGIPTLEGALPVFGHMFRLMGKKGDSWKTIDEAYRNHKESKFLGIYWFTQPSLMLLDPELAKLVCIKDFDHFTDRRNFEFKVSRDDIFNYFLTNITGEHWKGVRSVLSPSFTSGRMKGMFPLVSQKADNLADYILKKQVDGCSTLCLKRTFSLYTLEVIASCAFGMDAGCLENENATFVTKAGDLNKVSARRFIKLILFMSVPRLCEALGMRFMQESMQFFLDAVRGSIAQREAGYHRGDFLDLMLEAKADLQNPNSKMPKFPLTENNIVANSVLFILAGFDTTATTLSFIMFLLAKNPEVQERLREEIRDIEKDNEGLTYQGIMEAKFLDACLSESLRMYAPAPVTERKCTKDYRIPGTDLLITKDMMVSVPIYSFHHDEEFWSEPEEFRPERFLPENRENVKSGTYLPFGIGPRNCIGMRFAQMEAKLAIAKIILQFELSCAPGHEQMRFQEQPGLIRPADDLPVVFKPLEKME